MTDEEWRSWLAGRPPGIRAVAEKLGRHPCYRSTENGGHYALYSIDEHPDGSLSVKIIHGADSYLPGTAVFGVDPETLVPCGCGRWRTPTEAQLAAMAEIHEELEKLPPGEPRLRRMRELLRARGIGH